MFPSPLGFILFSLNSCLFLKFFLLRSLNFHVFFARNVMRLPFLIALHCDAHPWPKGCVCVCVCLLSCIWLFVTLWTAACQAPLSMQSSGKSTGVCCHSLFQGILRTQGSNPHLLHLLHWQMDYLPLATWEAPRLGYFCFNFYWSIIVLKSCVSF